ncbi:hypothetical protein, conserved [Plasmodium gonderi]|uniref:Uncharacterized protein n=1 Tax=Plasmodium gonderi TaxID=77519 RepID=A0A1Y1JK92_PLAGO|nr:hypothetical protein, conserved [Plasmodium gonderi]GAW81835.1 hypothetical protein, conserved [Plasmodium gonderi]
MVEINEIEFIEDTEYFKFQHGACFCMVEEEKKRKKEFSNVEKNIPSSNFIISNTKQKGLYFFNQHLNIFSLSDFLYKIDNENNNDSNDKINIKTKPFEENILLIENNKTDALAFLYTDRQNFYVFDYDSDNVKLHCTLGIQVRSFKHIDDLLFLVLSDNERVYLLKDKQLYECQEWTTPVNNIDEKNGVFLLTYSNKEVFILKDEKKSNTYDLSNISKEIDVPYQSCNITCAKILETTKKKRKLFLVVLYNDSDELTAVTYDVQIEHDKIKRVNYSINDYFFQNFDKNTFVKCTYISEWKTVISISSESCEAVIHTHNHNMIGEPKDEEENANMQKSSDGENNEDLKILCIKEGYKMNTRESETFFLSLFMYSKYQDKIYRKSKLGNVPFLKNPSVFFVLQDNQKIVVEYLDKYKLVDNTDFSINVNNKETNECEMKEVTILPPLKHDIIELYEPVSFNIFKIFKVKEIISYEKMSQVKGDEPVFPATIKQSFFDIFQSKIKSTEEKVIEEDNKEFHFMKEHFEEGYAIGTIKQKKNCTTEENEVGQVYQAKQVPTQQEKYDKNQILEKRQQLYKSVRKSKKIYEDENFIVNELSEGFNKLIKSGIYFCEDFLNHLNVYSIEKRKISNVGSRKKECYYDKKCDTVVFLRDSVIGQEVEEEKPEDDNNEEKKKKKKLQKTKKSEFHDYFHCEDFNFYKHKKLSDIQCEKIISKIERKQHFLYDLKRIFINEDRSKGDETEEEDEKKKKKKKTVKSFQNEKPVFNEQLNGIDKTVFNQNEKTNELFSRAIQVRWSNEERKKFYENLDLYFSKRKLLKVNNEIFNILRTNDHTSINLLETVLYNISKYSELKHCEALIYFILKNIQIKLFSSSLFLLEMYFFNLLEPYLTRNELSNLQIYDQKNMLKEKFSLRGHIRNRENCNNNTLNVNLNYNDKECNLDSEYSTDNYSEDDLLKKIKNEKNSKKKNEYLSKMIPLFNERTNKESELIEFHLMHAGVDFLNNRLCHTFSQKLFPILIDNNLNQIDTELSMIKSYISHAILGEETFNLI